MRCFIVMRALQTTRKQSGSCAPSADQKIGKIRNALLVSTNRQNRAGSIPWKETTPMSSCTTQTAVEGYLGDIG